MKKSFKVDFVRQAKPRRNPIGDPYGDYRAELRPRQGEIGKSGALRGPGAPKRIARARGPRKTAGRLPGPRKKGRPELSFAGGLAFLAYRLRRAGAGAVQLSAW